MIKLVSERNINLDGYNDHINSLPSHDTEEVELKDFLEKYFLHNWDYEDYKQIKNFYRQEYDYPADNSLFPAKLFIKEDFEKKHIGIMVVRDIFTNEFLYYKFGDWKTFSKKFSRQF